MEKYCLRKAEWKDKELLYEWRNDVAVRCASFHSEEIPLAGHERWLRKKLADPFSRIYILEVEGIPVGQARLDRKRNEAYISYSISSSFRKRGYGKMLLRMVEQEVVNKTCVLVGEVKKDNAASRAVFRSLGYEEREREEFFEYRKTAGESSYENSEREETVYHCRAFWKP